MTSLCLDFGGRGERNCIIITPMTAGKLRMAECSSYVLCDITMLGFWGEHNCIIVAPAIIIIA